MMLSFTDLALPPNEPVECAAGTAEEQADAGQDAEHDADRAENVNDNTFS